MQRSTRRRPVLTDGGHLLIELPDPDYALRKVLRGGWIPYRQPQHLHLVGLNNLKRALEERGFVVVAEECGAAHQPNDVMGALLLQFSRLARPPGLPWRPASSRLRGVWHATLMTVMTPFLVLCAVVDLLVFRFARHSSHGNVYRLVARLGQPDGALKAQAIQ